MLLPFDEAIKSFESFIRYFGGESSHEKHPLIY